MNLKKKNYDIAELNDTEMSETILKLKFKLYLLQQDVSLHTY